MDGEGRLSARHSSAQPLPGLIRAILYWNSHKSYRRSHLRIRPSVCLPVLLSPWSSPCLSSAAGPPAADRSKVISPWFVLDGSSMVPSAPFSSWPRGLVQECSPCYSTPDFYTMPSTYFDWKSSHLASFSSLPRGWRTRTRPTLVDHLHCIGLNSVNSGTMASCTPHLVTRGWWRCFKVPVRFSFFGSLLHSPFSFSDSSLVGLRPFSLPLFCGSQLCLAVLAGLLPQLITYDHPFTFVDFQATLLCSQQHMLQANFHQVQMAEHTCRK